MKRITQRTIMMFLIMTCILLPPLAQSVAADYLVWMTCPEQVSRGYSITVEIYASGAAQGMELVELSLKYPRENFQFIKADSVFMGTTGDQVRNLEDGSVFSMQDTGEGIVELKAMHYAQPGNDLVAQLVFTAKVDANLGNASFKFIGDSYVTTALGNIPANSELLTLQIIDSLDQPLSNEPLPPGEIPADPTGPTVDVPYQPDNQRQPEPLEGDSSNYGIGALNEEEEVTVTPTEKPSLPTPPTPQQRETEIIETESPLRSVTGELLYPPKDGLKPINLPAGFRGGMEVIKDVNVPVAQAPDSELRLYYLADGPSGQPDFYTFEASTDRFKRYDVKAADRSAATSQAKFTADRPGDKTWQILLLSLLGLSALSVFLYTLNRNLRH